ncbi:uncharacterized protein LOC100302440 isoform X1 [Acyrthosiphon pisum]|uniref:Regulatory protein zeste n=1 Tax=Acyrthosiphon pisum TaxID=7029 RepID=A0A8R2H6P0_ACYPI|nr:uncharacterized protein LOC100302440 isoform X1 [Acyrthosiphon pisum]|eukprot:XP_016657737.1 PREDICTED: uncharacterized protein LOC100302440 isoform X1 [Acyrthosiphon pisum]
MSGTKARPTKAQMKLLVELLSVDPQLNAAKFSANFTHNIARGRWENIALQLNALPGAEKNWEKWKKAWQDTKVTAKNKASAIKRHRNGTGGGPPCNITMSEAQTDAMSLISNIAISGHTDSKESICELDFDTSVIQGPCKLDLENMIVCNNSEGFGIIQEIDTYELPNYLPVENNSIQMPTTSIINVNVPEEIIEQPTTSNLSFQSIKRKNIEKTKPVKKPSIAAGLHDSNLAAKKLGDIATQKLELKTAYYAKKIQVMEEQVSVLKNIGTMLSSFINK